MVLVQSEILISPFFRNLFSGMLSKKSFFAFRLIFFVSVLYWRFFSTYSSSVQTYFAGLPATTTLDGTDFVTILPAAIKTLLPMVTPGIIFDPAPTYTLSPRTTLPKRSKLGYLSLATRAPPWVYIFVPSVSWQKFPIDMRYGSVLQNRLAIRLCSPIFTPASRACFSSEKKMRLNRRIILCFILSGSRNIQHDLHNKRHILSHF